MLIRKLIIGLIPLFITGCSFISAKNIEPYAFELPEQMSLPEPSYGSTDCEIWTNHVLATNRRGEFKPILFEAPNKQCRSENLPKTERIKKIIDNYKKSGRKRLMVFIHGGLNDYNNSLTRVTNELKQIMNDRTNDYPLFIIWPSEMFDSYLDSLLNYYQGTWDHPDWWKSVPFKVSSDLGEIVVHAPNSYYKQTDLWINSRCLNEAYRSWLPFECGLEIPAENRVLYAPTHDPCQEKPSSAYKCHPSSEKIGWDFDFNIQRLINTYALYPLKLLLTPVVDPLGHRDWNSLISRSRFTMLKPCSDEPEVPGSCEEGVVKYFFDELSKKIVTSKTTEALTKASEEITLIGHSMGTIVASEIIATHPNLPYRNVVFLGAAVSYREFNNSVLNVLKGRTPDNKDQPCDLTNISNKEITATTNKSFCFFNVSLHPYAEATEENYFGAAPSGSLPEWIDLNFKAPADVADRTMARWANIAPLIPSIENGSQVKDMLGKNIFFTRYGLDNESPHTHGGLATPKQNGCYWVPSYWIGESPKCSYNY